MYDSEIHVTNPMPTQKSTKTMTEDHNNRVNFASYFTQFQTSLSNTPSSPSSLSDDVSPHTSMAKRREDNDSANEQDHKFQKTLALTEAADALASLGRSTGAAYSQSRANSIGSKESVTYESSVMNGNVVARAVSRISSLSDGVFESCNSSGSSDKGGGSFVDAPGGFGEDDGAVSSGKAEKAVSASDLTTPSLTLTFRNKLPVAPKERHIPPHKKKNCAITFPEKLMSMLEYAEEMKAKSGNPANYCISWLPKGDAFLVRDPTECAERVIPLFFKAAKFSSFTRKLYRWGFHQVERNDANGPLLPPHAMVFASEHFKRDARHEMVNMRSVTTSGQKRKNFESVKSIALVHNSSENSSTGMRIDNCSSASKRARGVASSNEVAMSEANMCSKSNDFSNRRNLRHHITGVSAPTSVPQGTDSTQRALEFLKRSALDHNSITSLKQQDQGDCPRGRISLCSRRNRLPSTIQMNSSPNAEQIQFSGLQQSALTVNPPKFSFGTNNDCDNFLLGVAGVAPRPSEIIQEHAASAGISVTENSAFKQALASMPALNTHLSRTGQFNILPSPTAMPVAPAHSPSQKKHSPSDRNLSMKSQEGTSQNSTPSLLPGLTNLTNTTSSIRGNQGCNTFVQHAFDQALSTLLLPRLGPVQQSLDTIMASMKTNSSSSATCGQSALNAHQNLTCEMGLRNPTSLSISEVLSGQVDSNQEKKKLAKLLRSAAETLEKENSNNREQQVQNALSVIIGHFQHQGNTSNQLNQHFASSQQRRDPLENAFVAASFPQHPTNVYTNNSSIATNQNQHCGNHVVTLLSSLIGQFPNNAFVASGPRIMNMSGRVNTLNYPLNSSSGTRDHSHENVSDQLSN